MRKSKSGIDSGLGDLPLYTHDEDELLEDPHLRTHGFEPESDAAGRRLPARRRVDLRHEQRTLREQLSDWDDYDDDFDTRL